MGAGGSDHGAVEWQVHVEVRERPAPRGLSAEVQVHLRRHQPPQSVPLQHVELLAEPGSPRDLCHVRRGRGQERVVPLRAREVPAVRGVGVPGRPEAEAPLEAAPVAETPRRVPDWARGSPTEPGLRTRPEREKRNRLRRRALLDRSKEGAEEARAGWKRRVRNL